MEPRPSFTSRSWSAPPAWAASLAQAAVLAVTLAALPSPRLRGAENFVRGRANADALVNISDAIAILDYLFLGRASPPCLDAADTNDDGQVNLSDAVFLLEFLFLGGAVLPPPHPSPGSDPTPDGLGCGSQTLTDLAAGPSPLALDAIGRTAQLEVTAAIGGERTDVHSAAAGTTYASSAPAIAGVYRDGLVEARGVGRATITVCSGGFETAIEVQVTRAGGDALHHVLAVNDLGMHCMDREFSIFAILPPYNVLHAQVARAGPGGQVTLLDESQVDLRYSAVPDSRGSINSTSLRKSDFWDHALEAFGADLAPGAGFFGLFLPDDAPAPGPQPLAWSAERGWFEAPGIPITAADDAGAENAYPLLRVAALDRATGAPLAHLDVVVPVSNEIDCRSCHATGQLAASAGFVRWWRDEDLELQAKKNILAIHDYRSRTALLRSTPVLCAGCHYSAALDLAGQGPNAEQRQHSSLSEAMHGFHGLQTDAAGAPLFPAEGPAETTCYNCHPGKVTQCQRGAMKTAGLECKDCHGSMRSVAGGLPLAPGGSIDGANDGLPRRPWIDMPRCQSCHTGDAVNRLSGPEYVAAEDGIRLRQAFRAGDESASPILASNQRFAEEPGKLFRFSKGHGGILCENCHGSTHAEWPNADPAHNDNVAATQLQGHAGAIVECTTCHAPRSVALGLGGPHGLHPVGDVRWVKGHGEIAEHNAGQCRACHGKDLLGSVLGRAAADRVFRIEDDQTVRIAKGEAIRCDLCHSMPRV